MGSTSQVWNHSKYSQLVNYLTADVDDLHDAVALSLTLQEGEHALLRSYFQHAGLSL
jgi:hypothetical protein